MTKDKCGVIIISIGEKYQKEAIKCAKYVKKNMPDIKINLYSDTNLKNAYIDEVIKIDKEVKYFYLLRMEILQSSPFDKTLYLDTDVCLVKPIYEVISSLNQYTIAVAHAPNRIVISTPDVPICYPEFNCGVIALKKCSESNNIIELWKKIYIQQIKKHNSQYNKKWVLKQKKFFHDQSAFREALYKLKPSLLVLPPEYNFRYIYPGYVQENVKVLHGRYTDVKRLERKLNKSNQPRVFIPPFFVFKRPSIIYRIHRKINKFRQK